MNAAKKFYLLLLGLFLISSMAYANGLPPQSKTDPKPTVKKIVKKKTPHKISSVKNFVLPHFSSIETDGNFNVLVVSGPQRVEISRAEADRVNAYVNDEVLHLSVIPDENGDVPEIDSSIKVRVAMQNLNDLVLSGGTSITAQNFHGEGLIINAGDQSHVSLNGNINANKIIATGDSEVNLHWINSYHLVVEAHGNSQIFLAGTVDRIAARLFDDAHLDAKYLRAKEVWVATRGSSTAEVLAVNSLSAFAYDTSNIYYYKTASHLLDYSELSGNVLQMGYWR